MRSNYFSTVAGKFLRKNRNSEKEAMVLAFTEGEDQVVKHFGET